MDSCLKVGGIYKITNLVNGKIYVGSTGRSLQRRKLEHFKDLRKGNHHNRHLQFSFNKYGESNFLFEVIEYIPKNNLSTSEYKQTLLKAEQYWIETLDSIKHGYNIRLTPESNLGLKMTSETSKKISKIHKGKIVSESTRKKLSEAHKRAGKWVGENNYMFGKRGSNNPKSISVVNINTGEIFGSIVEASIAMEVGSSGIISCCRRRQLSSNGYCWMYLKEWVSLPKQTQKDIKIKANKIRECFINKEVKKEERKREPKILRPRVLCLETGLIYKSTRDAERLTKISHSCISASCRGVRKSAGGYHWKYVQ